MAPTPPPSILVLGAGELGTAILSALSAHPSHPSLTVLLRPSTLSTSDPKRRAEIDKITALGVSSLAGYIASATTSSLTSLFAPFHTIIGCTGMFFPPGTQTKIAQAVLAAKTPRYIPWQFGVDYDVIGRESSQHLFAEQLDVRDLLRGQKGTKWVIVSTGMFMSFLFWSEFGVVDEGYRKVQALGGWDNKVTVTSVEGIGRVVAEIACVATEVKGVVFTSGETVSYGRLAEIVENVMGREVEREVWDTETLKQDLAENPDDGLKKYRVVFAEGRGVAWDEGKTFNAEKGIVLQGVEEWFKMRVER